MRGVYNMFPEAASADLRREAAVASAVNHEHGMSLAATRICVSATIAMPAVTPKIKADASKRRGAQAILNGENFGLANACALALAADIAAIFVPPFDHPEETVGVSCKANAATSTPPLCPWAAGPPS